MPATAIKACVTRSRCASAITVGIDAGELLVDRKNQPPQLATSVARVPTESIPVQRGQSGRRGQPLRLNDAVAEQ